MSEAKASRPTSLDDVHTAAGHVRPEPMTSLLTTTHYSLLTTYYLRPCASRISDLTTYCLLLTKYY